MDDSTNMEPMIRCGTTCFEDAADTDKLKEVTSCIKECNVGILGWIITLLLWKLYY